MAASNSPRHVGAARGADPDHGTSLTGLADRAAVINGRMLLSSPAG